MISAVSGEADHGEQQVEADQVRGHEDAQAAGQRQQPPHGDAPAPGSSRNHAAAYTPAAIHSSAAVPSRMAAGRSRLSRSRSSIGGRSSDASDANNAAAKAGHRRNRQPVRACARGAVATGRPAASPPAAASVAPSHDHLRHRRWRRCARPPAVATAAAASAQQQRADCQRQHDRLARPRDAGDQDDWRRPLASAGASTRNM